MVADLDLSKMQQDWSRPAKDLAVEKHPLSIGGQAFSHGIGSHASSALHIDLGGTAEKFSAMVGVDDEVKHDAKAVNFPVEFTVFGDNKVLFSSGPMHISDHAKAVNVDLHGVKHLVLALSPLGEGITFCHGDWAEASITYSGEKPTATVAPVEAAGNSHAEACATPQINGAKVVGVRPTHPLIFHVAVTGDRPIKITAENLPAGLSLDSETGQITGAVAEAGKYVVHLHASNSLGKADRDLRIEVGDKIAAHPPPMGWNSWNCFATRRQR